MTSHRVDYEWVVETVDEFGDIIECVYFDEAERAKAADCALDFAKSADANVIRIDFGLCRHVWVELDGEIEREYAYANDQGRLPEKFEYGTPVPKRFLK